MAIKAPITSGITLIIGYPIKQSPNNTVTANTEMYIEKLKMKIFNKLSLLFVNSVLSIFRTASLLKNLKEKEPKKSPAK